MSISRGLAAILAAAVLVLPATGHAGAATPTFAGSLSACSSTAGSAVAVDFGTWSGPVALGCDTSQPANGLQLLSDTGFTTVGTKHDGPAFVCRIGSPLVNGGTQYPTPADQACVNTPPPSAYWSYWVAPTGQGTWTSTAVGASSHQPSTGEVEAWAFGSGTQPTFTPDQVRAFESPAGGTGSGSGGGSTPVGSQVLAPTLTTGIARHVEGVTATLSGQVTPGSSATTVYFQFGRSRAYGHRTPGISLPAGKQARPVTAALAGLTPHAGYHFRLVGGLHAGTDHTFTTLPVPRGLSLHASRRTAGGTLELPHGLRRALGCRGTVTVVVRRGRSTVLTLHAPLTARCTYARSFGTRATGRLAVSATFGGNASLGPLAARTASVSVSARAAAATAHRPDLRRAVTFLVSSRAANGLSRGTSLRTNGYYESAPHFADFGLTLDGGLALAATRSEDPVLRKVVAFIRTGRDGSRRTVDTWTGIGTSSADAGAIAKEALLAEATGYNPRNFGGHDLIGALDSLVDSTTASTFDQALVVIAELRAGHGAQAASAAARLGSVQRRDGGWASLPAGGRSSETDSTAIASMALVLVPHDAAATAAARRGVSFLAHRQARDGGFPGAAGISTNSTALAIQALRLESGNASRIARGLGFLASRQNRDGGFAVAAVGSRSSDVRASTQIVNGTVGTSFGRLRDDIA